jgi:hypothetical protein
LTVYLSSPGSQMHAAYLEGWPVLLSFATYYPWVDDYLPSFGKLLIDSGAFSELNSGTKIDGAAYKDWYQKFLPHAEAVAGLDDIRGDWKKSLRNYERYGGFPTFHETDPPELLDDLVPLARERGGWLGLGLLPPRDGKEAWVRAACKRVPPDLHVHGWACRAYLGVRRIDSADSTNWFRDAWMYKQEMPFLTPAQALQIVLWRYRQKPRVIRDVSETPDLFTSVANA